MRQTSLWKQIETWFPCTILAVSCFDFICTRNALTPWDYVVAYSLLCRILCVAKLGWCFGNIPTSPWFYSQCYCQHNNLLCKVFEILSQLFVLNLVYRMDKFVHPLMSHNMYRLYMYACGIYIMIYVNSSSLSSIVTNYNRLIVLANI